MENQQNIINQETKPGRSRRWISVIALFVCCAALIATGTLAFFTAEETANNVITTATFDVELKEETDGGEPWPDTTGISGIMPGDDVTKVVYVENIGTADAYVRLLLNKTITPAEGVEAELNFEHITLDINTADWTEKDGYYYYNKALKPGEETEPLLTKVHFGAELGNEYMNATAEIEVIMQAVQSRNNTDSPLTAAGWPEA